MPKRAQLFSPLRYAAAFETSLLMAIKKFELYSSHRASGLQEELSQPVAVLLNVHAGTIAMISHAGFRCFTDVGEFPQNVPTEVVGEEVPA